MNIADTVVQQQDPWGPLTLFFIAVLASYLMLDLSKRMHRGSAGMARTWWLGGSLALGTGVWAMHFAGMLAYSEFARPVGQLDSDTPLRLFFLPRSFATPSGFALLPMFGSWAAAVAVAASTLAASGRKWIGRIDIAGTLWFGRTVLTISAGMCAMHYLAITAMDASSCRAWIPAKVVTSIGASILAAAIVLMTMAWLNKTSRTRMRGVPDDMPHSRADARKRSKSRRRLVSGVRDSRLGVMYQAGAAIGLGFIVSCLHFAGMTVAGVADDVVCSNAVFTLTGGNLIMFTGLISSVMMSLSLLASILNTRTQSRTQKIEGSLEIANQRLLKVNTELKTRAFIDSLTGLANRLMFEDRLAQAVSRSKSSGRTNKDESDRVGVLFIDLDGFKSVNDTLGHAAGDKVLVEVAARLCKAARDSDMLARVGGDEFVLLIEQVNELADCVFLADRFVRSLRQPFDVGGQKIDITCSVGIALYPDHGAVGKMVSSADAAMYAAKRAGGNTYAIFDTQMTQLDAQARGQIHLQKDLRHAVERHQLQLHYQPKVDSRRGQLSGVEALLRWNHPIRGQVSPGEFIPVAERFGLIIPIGNWVIDESCRQIEEWADQGLRMRVAINLSVHQLRDNSIVERIGAALRRHSLEPSQLLCEITESVAMEDIKATQRAFEGLARIGVFLSIDDFGTGYSSLSYLRQLPARQLKIDRSFIADLEDSMDARAIVDAVIKLAHALGLRVVGEGVETQRQHDILLELECDELQGYLFGRPMPATTLMAWAFGTKPAGALDFTPSVMQSGV